MTENKRFNIDKDKRTIIDNIDESYCECVDSSEAKEYCRKMNELHEENEQSKMMIATLRNMILENEDSKQENKELKHQIKKLEKELHLTHIGAMFSTVKSFNGDISKRYYYSEKQTKYMILQIIMDNMIKY